MDSETMTRTAATKRHLALAAEVRRHDEAYYVHARPTISDQDYDRLYRELLDLEKQFPDLVTSAGILLIIASGILIAVYKNK